MMFVILRLVDWNSTIEKEIEKETEKVF